MNSSFVQCNDPLQVCKQSELGEGVGGLNSIDGASPAELLLRFWC